LNTGSDRSVKGGARSSRQAFNMMSSPGAWRAPRTLLTNTI